MARENYEYIKRQKELARKKKNEEKRQNKLNKKKEEEKTDAEQGSNEITAA